MRHHVEVQIEAKQIVWQFKHTTHGLWVARCEALGQVVQANRYEKLPMLIVEVMNSLFVDLFEEGELTSFLKKQGWKAASPIPQASATTDGIAFAVPFALMAAKNAEARART